LYIGGDALARGYLNRPELTAERFVPDPFGRKPGVRLYRTGDVAYYRPDGAIKFLGRSDSQVKIRGFRIELGEVEQALLQCPGVQAAVAVAHERRADSKQLVAYVVLAQGQEAVEQAAVRAYLRERLPEYMIPSLFIVLDALPLTSSGKVDRRALPAPEQVTPRAGQQEDSVARTSVEQLLTEIWSQVLRLPQVGIHDNFFALGGDSILSLSLIAQARRAGLQLTIRQLFQAPTIAQLSQLATQVTPPDSIATSRGQERGSSQGSLSLTPIQRWFFEQGLHNPHHWNQAFLLHLPAELSVARLEQALQWVLSQHDVFRLRFVPPSSETEEWQASYLPVYEPVPFALVDLRELPEEQQTSRLSERCSQEQASLHLQQGPLARAMLFHLTGEQPWRLLLVSHHLVIDTVSWRILLEELSGAYERLQQGLSLEPLPASSSFQEWAQRLQDYVQTEAMQQEVSFWLQQASSLPALPVDDPTGANGESYVQTIEQHLGLEETRALLREVPQYTRASVEEVLLTALALACSDCFGSAALAIELEGHGRQELFADVDLSRTVGWFTSTFPLVLEVGPRPEPMAVLRLTRSQLRRLPQRGIGYGLLRYLHPDAQLRQRLQEQGQPAVSFNYLGQFDQVLGEEALFALAPESAGRENALENQRTHQLDVVALIVGEQLHLLWQYSAQLYHAQTMLRLAQSYLTRLQQVISLTQAAVFRKR
jgi:non-ribosomal peptide synthase protein (TIGR01720 family)